jgi:hypothetical protein
LGGEKHEEDHLLVNIINQRNITKNQRNTARNIIIKNPKNIVKNKFKKLPNKYIITNSINIS